MEVQSFQALPPFGHASKIKFYLLCADQRVMHLMHAYR